MSQGPSIPFDHIAIRVQDIQRSIQFYRDELGQEVRRATPDQLPVEFVKNDVRQEW